MKKMTHASRNRWAFSLGSVGRDMVYNLFTMYLMTFIIYTKSLTNAQYAAVGAIFVACRVFDAVIDPFIGGMVDNTHSRFGKFKPWIFAGMVIASVDLVLLFSVPLYGWGFVGFLTAGYVVFSASFSLNDISYWGMLPALSSVQSERHKLVSVSNICSGAGTAVIVALVPVLSAGQFTIGGNAVRAYAVIAAFSAVFFIGFQSITLFWVKEPREVIDDASPDEKFGFKATVQTVVRNDQLMWASFVLLLQCILGGLGSAGLSMAYIYIRYGYNGMLMPLSAAGGISTAFITLFLPQILRRITRKRLIFLSCLSLAVGSLIMLISGLMPKDPMLPGFLVFTFASVFTFSGIAAFYQVLFIDLANTVEYNEWKTGHRSESLIFSMRPLMVQISSAVTQLIIMVIFLALGITQVNKGISDLENAAERMLISSEEKLAGIQDILNAVSGGKATALLVCLAVLPTLIAFIGYWVYKKKFKLDEETYENILKDLKERESVHSA
ncbi:MAG: MFS transporter [Oscillospiraceae bacterium]|nr:MFS transporter [Oscillospiraceae bacterium]